MRNLVRFAAALGCALAVMGWAQSRSATQQTPARQAPPVLVITGEQDQAALLRLNGRAYVDVEALARITHATVRYVGNQIVLTLPAAVAAAPPNAPSAGKNDQLSGAFLAAEIEALTAIREWRVSLVNAVQSNTPLGENWIGPLRRFADSKLQLAAAAATTEPDHTTLELLRNEYNNMLQESDSFLAMHQRVNYIPPDSFDNNAQDQKVLACQRALAQVAASRQFQDHPSCH